MFHHIFFLFFKLTLLVFFYEMHFFPKKKVLNAILNDASEEEIRGISTVVMRGMHLVSHISNFRR